MLNDIPAGFVIIVPTFLCPAIQRMVKRAYAVTPVCPSRSMSCVSSLHLSFFIQAAASVSF